MRNLDVQRRWIISVWFVGLVVNLILILDLDFSQYQPVESPPEAWREPIDKVYRDLLALYAPPLTTMLAIAFARKSNTSSRLQSSAPFVIAILSSLIWNGTVIVQNVRMSLLHALDIQSFASFLPLLPGELSFLITPFLAFYFSSEQS